MDPFDAARPQPLPVSLEDAHREIVYLRKQVFRARQDFAKQVVEREKDKRAARGNIKAVAEQNAELRGVVNNIDFALDEFGVGYCARPRLTEDAEDVHQAVKTAMATLRVRIAELTANRKKTT